MTASVPEVSRDKGPEVVNTYGSYIPRRSGDVELIRSRPANDGRYLSAYPPPSLLGRLPEVRSGLGWTILISRTSRNVGNPHAKMSGGITPEAQPLRPPPGYRKRRRRSLTCRSREPSSVGINNPFEKSGRHKRSPSGWGGALMPCATTDGLRNGS